jgi:HEAT repeat protein
VNYPFHPLRNNVNTLQDLLNDLTSGDETRAEDAVSALLEKDEEAIPALLEMTKSNDADKRWWALRVLAQTPHSRTEWLIPFLNDPAADVRQCAALGLSFTLDESATEPLIRALSDEDTLVSNLAVKALVKLGKAAVPALIENVKGGSQSSRILALRALVEIRDHRAIPVMMQVMNEESALLQYWAKEGLERLGLDMVYMKPV